MIGLNLAVVHQQLPEKNGVLVAWRDGTSQVDSGTGYGFCRVGSSRAHPTLGSASDLPAVGELGLVATVDSEVNVWVCSLHWLDVNALDAVDPSVPRRSFWHHDSGACLQVDADGQFQVDLPFGLQIRANGTDTPWPFPGGSSSATPGGTDILPLTISHPSGLSIKVSPFGDIVIDNANSISASSGGAVAVTAYGAVSIETLPQKSDPNSVLDTNSDNPYTVPVAAPDVSINITGAGAVNVKSTGAVSIWGASVEIMQGAVQFVMQPFVSYITALFDLHTHSGVTSGSNVSGVPTLPSSPAPDSSLSGTALTGPVAQ